MNKCYEHNKKTECGCLVSMALVVAMLSAPGSSIAMTRTWSGGGVGALASTPSNWVNGAKPEADDDIVLNADTSKNMTWDLNVPVQSWTQDGYVGTVTVATVYPGQGAFTNFTILGDCIISNGVWTHNGNAATAANRMRATIGGNLIVGTNAAIDVTGKGYAHPRGGPGGGNAASHGGYAVGWGGYLGPCYGSIVSPTNLGSAGANYDGGGAVLLMISGEAKNDGLICADGAVGGYVGSGGSIWLIAGNLTGRGTIQANGASSSAYGGGGGGRIALTVTNSLVNFSGFTGLVTAYGGVGSGGAGTVYLRTAAQERNEGTLILDNNTMNGYGTEITSNVTDAVVGNVRIRNGANLVLCTNQIITVSGIWSNSARFTSQWGSHVVLAGAATSTIYGATTFMSLIFTNEGATLLFEPGPTNRFAAGESLTLRGAVSKTNLLLRSISPGQAWKLAFDGAATPSIFYVDVQDSDASSGAQVTAFFSKDSGGNSNWVFSSTLPGNTNVWTGTESTLWNVGANWQSGRAPYDDDFISIPNELVNYPVINGTSRTVAGLEIEKNASLNLNGYDLTVNGYARLAGTLTCSAGETVTFYGNTDFTGGSFYPASSTVIFSGDLPQTVAPDDLTFHRIIVNNTNTVTFTKGFSAHAFLCEPPANEMRCIVFNSSGTVTVDFLTLLSVPSTTNILLRGSNAGQHWRLTAVKEHSICGVDVKDCDASFGQILYASGSRDSGNNMNWDFAQSWAEWTGVTGNGQFSNAGNWWPMQIPSESDWVRVANARPVTITVPVTIGNLVVGGGTPAAQVTANAALNVRENVDLRTNSTLIVNRPCVIHNNMIILSGATLTHTVNASTEINKLDLTIGGNMTLDQGGIIDATEKGYGKKQGPGKPTTGAGGSYSGRGGAWNGDIGPCYGSIIAPTNLGSGGPNYCGGGAVLLRVAGEVRHNGLMRANGGGPNGYSAAGGSIFLTAGALTGSGEISANGGNKAGYSAGGGGRISLVLTNTLANFSVFNGIISASSGGSGAGAGTIYKQTTADVPGRGTVRLDNNSQTGYTDVPPMFAPRGEADLAVFYLTNAATLRLMTNFAVGNIWLDTANAGLDLGSNTLTVKTREHPLDPGTVVNKGAIVWTGLPPGVLIILK